MANNSEAPQPAEAKKSGSTKKPKKSESKKAASAANPDASSEVSASAEPPAPLPSDPSDEKPIEQPKPSENANEIATDSGEPKATEEGSIIPIDPVVDMPVVNIPYPLKPIDPEPVEVEAEARLKRPVKPADSQPLNDNDSSNKISLQELENYKKTYNNLIQELQDRLSHEEDAHSSLASTKKKLEGDLGNLKKEIEDLELALQKVIIKFNQLCLN